MKKSIGALTVLCAAGMLAACNGNVIGAGPGPTSGPSGNCGGPPSSNQLEMVYPIPNSKKAPPALANIYVATKGTLPPSNQFDFFLTQSNGGSTFTGPFSPINASQVPTPHAKPSYPNPTYYASAIAGPYGSSYFIGPDQSVVLLWNNGGVNCTPHFQVASFHTKA
ncbi:MAG: hypothetical protein WB609_12435 [Candidatus Cybelea sp.]